MLALMDLPMKAVEISLRKRFSRRQILPTATPTTAKELVMGLLVRIASVLSTPLSLAPPFSVGH
jgi:hypothetical protein